MFCLFYLCAVYSFTLHTTCLWSPVSYWVYFFSFSTALISRRFGKRVQDVRVVEAPVEVSLSFVWLFALRCLIYLCALAYSHLCIDRAVCLLKEYRAGSAPCFTEARLFLPGFLLLEVVSSPPRLSFPATCRGFKRNAGLFPYHAGPSTPKLVAGSLASSLCFFNLF